MLAFEEIFLAKIIWTLYPVTDLVGDEYNRRFDESIGDFKRHKRCVDNTFTTILRHIGGE